MVQTMDETKPPDCLSYLSLCSVGGPINGRGPEKPRASTGVLTFVNPCKLSLPVAGRNFLEDWGPIVCPPSSLSHRAGRPTDVP